MKFKYLIFDIDGTLISTEKMYLPALFESLDHFGYYFSQSQQRKLAKEIYGLAAIPALQYLGVQRNDITKVNQKWMNLAYQNFDKVTVIPGIPETLCQLAET